MRLQSIKMTLSAAWILLTLVAGLAAGLTSASALVALAALCLLPPLAMMLLWNDPAQTMSESINRGRQ